DWQARATAEPIKSGAETFLAGTASCRIKTDDVDALHAACEGHGIVHPQGSLEDKPYGLREFTVRDPDGNNVTFYQRIV
ncbi:MAG: VOC family protein, partial [Pseudomonadota bacterium]